MTNVGSSTSLPLYCSNCIGAECDGSGRISPTPLNRTQLYLVPHVCARHTLAT